MAHLSHRRLPANLRLALGFFLMGMLIPPALIAQVVIEERVEIADSTSFAAKALTTSDTLLIPSDGILLVRYDSAESAILQISQDADLTVTKNGQVFEIDTVRSRLGDPFPYSYWCSSEDNGDSHRYYPGSEPPASPAGKTQSTENEWIVGPVSVGDKIAFDYQGGRSGQYITGPSPSTQDSSWIGALHRCTIQGSINFYTDAIWFTVIVQPDTLTLEFEPSEDIFLPVPDTLIQVTAKVSVPADSIRFELLNDSGVYQAPDTTFTFEDSTTTSRSVIVQDGEASLNLRSFTYWGVAEVIGTAWDSGQPIAADTVRFPTDDDHDGIADVWEDSTGGTALADTFGVQNSADADWDWEWNPPLSMKNAGDGIPKIAEYQGVLIGDQHERLRPQLQEVFIDTTMALYADWAAGQVETQLGIKVHRVAGAYSTSDPVIAPKKLKWLGDALSRDEWYRNYILIIDDSVKHKVPDTTTTSVLNQNGVIFSSPGVYVENGLNVASCTGLQTRTCGKHLSDNIMYGETSREAWLFFARRYRSFSVANVFDGTIANIWNTAVNSINESSVHTFWHPVPIESSPRPTGNYYWNSEFLGIVDFSGDGIPDDDVNPFDMLSWGPGNDVVNLVVAGWTLDDMQKATTLHELGHSLGIRGHPTRGISVMRSGFGPARALTFANLDRKRIRLRK